MSVSRPAPLPSFGMAPKAPAPLKAPVKGSHAKALTHHAAVGKALKSGNIKTAMHHTGHMMLAMRGAMAPTQATGLTAPPSPASVMGAAESTEGTDETAESLPAMKNPSFNRAAFGAMKGK